MQMRETKILLFSLRSADCIRFLAIFSAHPLCSNYIIIYLCLKYLNKTVNEMYVTWMYLLDFTKWCDWLIIFRIKHLRCHHCSKIKLFYRMKTLSINKSNHPKFHKLVECAASTGPGANCKIELIYIVILWAACKCNAPILRTIATI